MTVQLPCIAAVCMIASTVLGQSVPLTSAGYTESFDSMATTGTTPPAGWSVWSLTGASSTFSSTIPPSSVGGGTQTAPPGPLAVFTQGGTAAPAGNNNGYNAGGGGAVAPTNRVLATSPTGVAGAVIQLWLENQTGGTVTGLTVGYSCRVLSVWAANELPGYSVFISTAGPDGPFVAVPVFDAAPTSADATGASISRLASVALPSPVGPAGGIWIRWVDDNAQQTSPDQLFGVDDVAVAALLAPTGACCAPNAGCQLALGPEGCAGTFVGLGTACLPDPCSAPLGSCCDAGGSCEISPSVQCPSGSWALAGACSPGACPAAGAVRFAVIGDHGADNAFEAAVASRVPTLHPQFIATVGDNTYFTNTDITNWDRTQAKYYAPFIRLPAGSAYLGDGSPINRFFPVMGNHDWDVGGSAASYTSYFRLPGNERYYTVRSGPVQLFMLSSDSRETDSNAAGGVQYNWFISQLAASTAPWKLVLFHHPAQTSTSGHAPDAAMRGWNFQSLGVTAVIQGHNHHSERLEYGGIPWFVAGASGQTLYGISVVDPNSAFRDTSSHTFVIVDATSQMIAFRFIDSDGATLDTRTIQTPSPGACCSGSSCTVTTAAACAGAFIGEATACGAAPGNPTTCCPANFNGSGGVSIQDLFDFLAAFFQGCPG